MEKKPSILIVEDEKVLAEMYLDKFTQAGYQVYLAFTAEDGIEVAQEKKPDLVLLDILLPRANGVEFLRQIRDVKKIASTPVVAFSNYDDPKTRAEAKSFGAKEYLLKTDYTPSEIIKKIKEYLPVGEKEGGGIAPLESQRNQ